jgi:hypothetical protein
MWDTLYLFRFKGGKPRDYRENATEEIGMEGEERNMGKRGD